MKRLLFLVMIVVISSFFAGCACDGRVPSVPGLDASAKGGSDKEPNLVITIEFMTGDAGQAEPQSEPLMDSVLDGGSSELVSDGSSDELIPEKVKSDRSTKVDPNTQLVFGVTGLWGAGILPQHTTVVGKSYHPSSNFNEVNHGAVNVDLVANRQLRLDQFIFRLSKSQCTKGQDPSRLLVIGESVLSYYGFDSSKNPQIQWKKPVNGYTVTSLGKGRFRVELPRVYELNSQKRLHMILAFKKLQQSVPRVCPIEHTLEFLQADNAISVGGGRIAYVRTSYNGNGSHFPVQMFGKLQITASKVTARSGWERIAGYHICHEQSGLDNFALHGLSISHRHIGTAPNSVRAFIVKSPADVNGGKVYLLASKSYMTGECKTCSVWIFSSTNPVQLEPGTCATIEYYYNTTKLKPGQKISGEIGSILGGDRYSGSGRIMYDAKMLGQTAKFSLTVK
jgi:hypothetical protein